MSTSADDLRTRVEDNLRHLSPTGCRVALLLLDEHDRLGFHSATDLARMAGTTDATVIRTVQRLGYSGIIELKADIARRLTPLNPAQRLGASIASGADPNHDLMVDIYDTQLRALNRLNQPDLHDAINDAVAAIAASGRVHINAHGVSAGLAAYAAAQLARIGVDARTLGGPAGITADDMVAIAPNDVVVAISSGLKQRWHNALYEHCGASGAQVILVTDTQPAPGPDSIVLRAGRGDPSGTATHVATVATIEAITLGVAAAAKERTTATLDQLNRHRERLTR